LIVLRYERGRVVAEGGEIPFGEPHGDTGGYRAPAIRYRDIIEHLKRHKTEYRDEADRSPQCPPLSSGINLRDYQEDALNAWREAGHRGVIVLPTGAGKTIVALKAIERLGVATLIVVPTLVLLEQWRQRIKEEFNILVGALGGGKVDIRPITVTTYASAGIRADKLGNRFRLLIFDEVHHLPAASYRKIALRYIAPYRMGLTATLNREDGSHEALSFLVGDVVHEMEVDELAGDYLAHYTVRTLHIPLSAREQAEYNENYGRYRSFLQRRGIRIRSARDYRRFVMRSGRDPEARRALLSRNRAMDLAQNSTSKVEYLKGLLKEHQGEKTLIFTRHNKLVYRISGEMLIPAITHQTPKEERREILGGFRSGRYMRVVTSRVLDEGVDVPDASLAVILSGTGSSRQFIQRLGRVLRKKGEKRARLVELVSTGTAETRISRRRKRR
jgi:superfamily II DNA or RNA helicase